MKKRELSIAFQTDKSAQAYVDLAKLVNQYDFDAVSVYCDAPFQPSFAPLLLMAAHIKKARLGAAAISPSRIHPMDIAANIALLSQLAQGGTYIGIARGAWLQQHGITELKPPVQAIREAIDIIHYFLAGRSDGYQGQVFQIAENVKAPYPLPEQKIPLLIGTWGKSLGALAGELADEVKIGGTANPDIVPIIRNYIHTGEKRVGREASSVNLVVGAVTVVDEDREQARQLARSEVALYLPIVAKLDPSIELEPEWVSRLTHHANNHDYDEAGKLISDDLLDRFAFSGNPSDIIRQCETLFDAGVNRIEFGTPHGIQSNTGIHLIGREILPKLRMI